VFTFTKLHLLDGYKISQCLLGLMDTTFYDFCTKTPKKLHYFITNLGKEKKLIRIGNVKKI